MAGILYTTGGVALGLSAVLIYVSPTFYSTLLLLTGILLLFGVLGCLSALSINIMLTSNHKTIVGAEHILKQSESFRNKLMVSVDTGWSKSEVKLFVERF